jgi:hypothetical protein
MKGASAPFLFAFRNLHTFFKIKNFYFLQSENGNKDNRIGHSMSRLISDFVFSGMHTRSDPDLKLILNSVKVSPS